MPEQYSQAKGGGAVGGSEPDCHQDPQAGGRCQGAGGGPQDQGHDQHFEGQGGAAAEPHHNWQVRKQQRRVHKR